VVQPDRRGRMYTYSWVVDGEEHPVADERRPAQAPARGRARRCSTRSTAPRPRRTRCGRPATSTRSAATTTSEFMKEYNGRLPQGASTSRAPADLEREGPRRHRHLPAQGREEPGFDRTHGRHQLPQDRRVRLRQRPAGVQLRRRVLRRQPRHHRVRRDAQARRRLPLRSPGGEPGAPDQAEEVRADHDRRGHRRAHERARVPAAPEQRVHGGAARPDHQDRRAVHHQAVAKRSGSTARTSTRTRSAPTSRPTRSRSRRCGRCSPGSRSPPTTS
jgi:hypothetical protein